MDTERVAPFEKYPEERDNKCGKKKECDKDIRHAGLLDIRRKGEDEGGAERILDHSKSLVERSKEIRPLVSKTSH